MRRCALVLVSLACGCFTADLDPSAAGAFACGAEPDAQCPEGLSCVNERCESAADLPTVQVGFPEDEQDVGLATEVEIGGRRTIGITVSGTLDLVPEGGEHVLGEGHLEVTADDSPPVIVSAGAGIIEVELEFDNSIGAHRISVRMIRNDGEPYDHADAMATRLFWMGDGNTPLIGIKSPWPGTPFGVDATTIDVETAVLGFTLQAADPTGVSVLNSGHVHIYYAQNIGSCVLDPDCDKNYLATIVGPGIPGTITLPDSGAGSFPLSVVLRNINHSVYLFDPTPDDEIDDSRPVIDEVSIVRR